MKNSVYRIALDMHKDASQYTLHAKRYDTARTIRATFTDGGKPFDVSGYYPILTGKNAAEETIYESCKIADNSVIYDFTAPLTDLPGVVECEIQLYNQDPTQGGAVMITSARFSVIVAEAVYQEGDPKAEANRDAFTQLLGETILAKKAANDAAAEANDAAAEVLLRADTGKFDGAPGVPGAPGKKGDKGDPGEPGKTPVAGVDFFTEADKAEMQDAVLSQIGIKQSASGTALTLRDSSDCKLQAFSIDGGTAGEMVDIEVSGKNLFDISQVWQNYVTADGGIKHAATGYAADIYTSTVGASKPVSTTPENLVQKLPKLPAGTYTISFTTNQADYFTIYEVNENGTLAIDAEGNRKTHSGRNGNSFTLTNATWITLRRAGREPTTTFYNIQIERGDTPTAYEPYKSQTVTVEATGGKVDVLEHHPWLRSYHHTTVVSNDRDIPMDVTYVADTKTYIDNKLTEVAAALL